MYVREIARWSQLALRTTQRELATLIKIGLVTRRTNGYRVFYRANRNHVFFAPLRQLGCKRERCVLAKRKPGNGRDSVDHTQVGATGRRKRERPSTACPETSSTTFGAVSATFTT